MFGAKVRERSISLSFGQEIVQGVTYMEQQRIGAREDEVGSFVRWVGSVQQQTFGFIWKSLDASCNR